MTAEPRFLPTFALMLSGLIAWIVHFGLIYAFTGLMCERPDWAAQDIGGIAAVPLGIVGITALVLAALAIILMAGRRSIPDSPFYRQITWGGAGLGAIAILWEGVLSVALVPSCF